jgi:hypothetical protein|nr:MAG TPA: hypothetical protein [Caudoviricetes sp.]
MINLLEVNFKENGELDVSLNAQLLYLFEDEEELISLVDVDALQKALIPLANKILAKAREVKINE